MNAEIVNLRQFRKKQARSEKEKQAEQNRITFGRTQGGKAPDQGAQRQGRESARGRPHRAVQDQTIELLS